MSKLPSESAGVNAGIAGAAGAAGAAIASTTSKGAVFVGIFTGISVILAYFLEYIIKNKTSLIDQS